MKHKLPPKTAQNSRMYPKRDRTNKSVNLRISLNTSWKAWIVASPTRRRQRHTTSKIRTMSHPPPPWKTNTSQEPSPNPSTKDEGFLRHQRFNESLKSSSVVSLQGQGTRLRSGQLRNCSFIPFLQHKVSREHAKRQFTVHMYSSLCCSGTRVIGAKLTLIYPSSQIDVLFNPV